MNKENKSNMKMAQQALIFTTKNLKMIGETLILTITII